MDAASRRLEQQDRVLPVARGLNETRLAVWECAAGEVAGGVVTKREKAVFGFGEFKSEVASRRNPDGSISFLTTIPGFDELEFVVGADASKRTLVFRDAQHEYTFTEK